jgi:hypothetical protein
MIQGEADYHWAVATESLGLDDPPVNGFMLDDGVLAVAWDPHGCVAPSVSGFALRHLALYLSITRNAGYYSAWPGRASREARMVEELAGSSTFEGLAILEGTDWIAITFPQVAVHVCIRDEAAVSTMPDPLLDLCRGSGSFGGIFRTQRNR